MRHEQLPLNWFSCDGLSFGALVIRKAIERYYDK